MFDYWRAAALVKISKYRDTACLVFGGRVSKQNTSPFICYLLSSSLKNCHSF